VTADVHLIALSAWTPVGSCAASTAAAVRAGVSRIREHPFMIDADGEPLRSGYVPAIEPELLGAARMVELARRALRDIEQALENAGHVARALPLWLALPEERPGFGAAQATRLVQTLVADARFKHGLIVHTEGRGHAGALLGLQRAVREIAGGREELCLVAGVDSYFDADTLDWLDADQRVSRASRRGGFPPGEAAAVLALASGGFQLRAGLPSLARIRSVACSHESRDETAPEGLLGQALTTVYLEVGAALLRPQERFDDLYCDINDERARTTDLGFALLRAGDLFRDGTAYVTPVPCMGEVGAATAALNCVLAARSFARGHAAGDNVLISAASWSGLRGAALLARGGG
jgi:3-oxoacyl-[acyl-carrier-protein] synthase I